MTITFFENFTSEVDISDRRQVHYLKKRLIPFSRTPFRHKSRDSALLTSSAASAVFSLSDSVKDSASIRDPRRVNTSSSSFVEPEPDKWDDEPVGERPPAWLELSADLAWTATFSSLTSNTEISNIHTVVSYAIFFTLMWQLWAAQASYDIKFYTNDWWHRLSFIFQLLVYGSLSAFTADFDVFWKLQSVESEVFIGDAPALTAYAIKQNDQRTKELSFQGIALIISISRLVLLIQYIRVAIYRRKHKVAEWQYMLTPICIFISTCLFLICFIVLNVAGPSQSTSIVQFLLWASAIIVEWLGHAFTPDDSKEKLRGHGSLTGRLSTLTVIVMGEGLNGLCATLRSTVNAVGFGFKMIVMVACAALMLYFYWLLYFDGFRERLPPKKSKKEVWLLLHLPFHLCLILFLEGMKNLLLYTNMTISTTFFINTLMSADVFQNGALVASARMTHLLQKIELSWDQQVLDSKAAFAKSAEEGMAQYYKWVLTVLYKLFHAYDNNLDPKAVFYYEQYMKDDTYVTQDVKETQNSPGFGKFWNIVLSEFETPFVQSIYLVIPVAGLLIISIGLLNYVQNRPRDKYSWGSVLTKCLAGVVLLLLTTTVFATDVQAIMMWRMPMISLTLASVAFIEMVLLNLSVRSIKRQEEGGNFTRDTGGNGASEYLKLHQLEQQQSRQSLIGNAQTPGQTTTIFSDRASIYSQAASVAPAPGGYPFNQTTPTTGYHVASPVSATSFQQQAMIGGASGAYPNQASYGNQSGLPFIPPPPPPPLSGQPQTSSSAPSYGGNPGMYDPWNAGRR